MKVIDLSERRKEGVPPPPLDALRQLIADIDAGIEPVPEKLVLFTSSADAYSAYAAGTSELEEVGLAEIGLSLLLRVATEG